MHIKLSIISININNKNGLRKTIESVVNQNFTNFEYIVIDGGSSDGSVEIIKEFEDKISYWISEPDKGIYNAMNKGIQVAKGEYLLFLNSGDWLVDEVKLSDVIENLNVFDLIIYDLFFVEEHNQSRKKHPVDITLSYIIEKTISHPSTFIKREKLL
jgi:glycosyltransferase involved in cell wall biosynthesis